MNAFLDTIRSALSTGQRQVLTRYFREVATRRAPGSPVEIEENLQDLGEILPHPGTDPTTSEGYNQIVRTAVANLAGLYQEIDNLESVQDGLDLLSRAELDRMEIAVRDLGTILESIKTANATNIQWTDVFFETFGAEIRREEDPVWYRPLPQLAASGLVESYLPLYIDPTDRALKLQPGGDFSRSVSIDGEPLVSLEVEEFLGRSSEANHPIGQAIDGRYFTFWRELVLTDAPIEADPLLVPWLPPTYDSGAAARLHFRFPFAVPFSEVNLRPFARFPIQVLQIIWDNRRRARNNRVLNGTFSSGAVAWTITGSPGVATTYPSVGGYENGSYVAIVAPSGRAYLVNDTFIASGTTAAYHLITKLQRTKGMKTEFQVHWKDGAGNTVRIDRDLPDTPVSEWYEYSKLFIAPSGWTTTSRAAVALVADGSGSCYFTDVSFSEVSGMENKTSQIDLAADVLSVPVDSALATDIWLVIAQPHYDVIQTALPEGDLDGARVWENVLLAAEGKAADVLKLETTSWALTEGITRPRTLINPNESPLMQEIYRLGGRIREMASLLVRYARPPQESHSISRYLYILGAWEIEVRHREYAPAGLFVSKPYRPRGEVRELLLLTNPPLRTLQDRVRFWLTARVEDQLDKAKQLTGRATFSSSTESMPPNAADTHFTLTPVLRTERFDGTDRNSRVTLSDHPYVNRESIWTIQTRLASGAIGEAVLYDPNKQFYTYTSGGVVRSTTGYRPVKITLTFPDGVIARPDVFGKLQRGDIAFSGAERLEEATVEQEIALLSESSQRRVNQRLRAIKPAQRTGALERLVQQELNRTSSVGLSDSRKITSRIPVAAYRTRFPRVISGQNGVAFSLYWHKSATDTTAGYLVTSGDVLISPTKYSIDTERGILLLRDKPPGGNYAYDSVIAYYYYRQGEGGSRALTEVRSTVSIPTSGIDFGSLLTQSLPITRNMTDYIHGNVDLLRPAEFDELSPEYHPVYEYLLTPDGRVLFANNLFRFGDTPAEITVEYETLAVAPRLLIEIRKAEINDYGSKTPSINDFTLYLNSRK